MLVLNWELLCEFEKKIQEIFEKQLKVNFLIKLHYTTFKLSLYLHKFQRHRIFLFKEKKQVHIESMFFLFTKEYTTQTTLLLHFLLLISDNE